MLSTAAFLAIAMQCAVTVHPDTAQDVARTESSFNPYAIGVVGYKKGLFPGTLNEAIAHVQQLESKGKNYSVGLMQINQSNFSRYGVTARQLFDPCTNLSVFEKIITDCYLRGGSLKRALSCYYSGNFDTGQRAEGEFAQTSYVQRIGYTSAPKEYVVPSTKTDQMQPVDAIPAPVSSEPRRLWPKQVIRGVPQSGGESSTGTPSRLLYPAQVLRGNVLSQTSSGIKNEK